MCWKYVGWLRNKIRRIRKVWKTNADCQSVIEIMVFLFVFFPLVTSRAFQTCVVERRMDFKWDWRNVSTSWSNCLTCVSRMHLGLALPHVYGRYMKNTREASFQYIWHMLFNILTRNIRDCKLCQDEFKIMMNKLF